MSCGAIVVAAGSSRRMGFSKTMASLSGRIVLFRVLDVLDEVAGVARIVVVVPSDDVEPLRRSLADQGYRCHIELCAGGRTRQESVRNGVRALPSDVDLVLVHDAARPLVTCELIRFGIGIARECGAAVAAVPVTDTIKLVDEHDEIEQTIDRSRLRAAQTPQVFRRSWLEDAYHRLDGEAKTESFTDESSLLEWAGYKVRVFSGSVENVKLTTPFDLALAESILARRKRLSP